ncbi:hypothetical protein SAMN02745121_06818 [Nannocystis exedens]|uniref:DUF7677 domain-containing protein n=2 Tax=Nannocystis exedens TaxID=54 RepID=A0A1I2FUX6_9BACT|nr:hypothetical protein [Nannocystis exedens]PCC73699.1 hypothetical protein NAEX_06787 [Nannocystis exedens]SFF08316.1 hypothetical protein SAMN02745121_06818 [Nannocystis exedens]
MIAGPSHDDRSSLRFFAFYVGNGTLFLPRERGEDEVDYLDALVEPGPALGRLFSVYAHARAAELRGAPLGPGGPGRRAARWFRSTFRPAQTVEPPVQEAELAPGCGVPWLDAVARFAAALGEGRLAPEVLAGREYVSALTCDGTGAGSTLELIVAIFTNVLALTGDEATAVQRTAQHVRSLVDDDYVVEPPFTEEETALWL